MHVLIADDHPLFRDAISRLIKQKHSETIIYEVATYQEIISSLEKYAQIDFLFIDLHMPEGDPFNNIANIHKQWPLVPITVISGSESIEDSRNAVVAGAIAYLPKSLQGKSLENAITTILEGKACIIPKLNPSNITSATQTKTIDELAQKLTERQKQVLLLLREGDSNKHIARKLDVSEGTVKLHVRAILQALDVANRTQAVSLTNHIDLEVK